MNKRNKGKKKERTEGEISEGFFLFVIFKERKNKVKKRKKEKK